MSQRTSISNSSFYSNKKPKIYGGANSTIGTVIFVHLDDSEAETIKLPSDLTDTVSDKELVVGYCKIVRKGESTYNIENIPEYPPLNSDEGIPLLGESVELVEVGGKFCYRRIPNSDLNSGNAREDALLFGYPDEESGAGSKDYNETSQTGTANSSEAGDRKTKLGEYFETTQINPLKLYEGDKLIQSRFGQSIRFSGYNNEENKYAPTILIRNRQNDKSVEDLKEFELTEENVIEDGSTIAITSGDYLLGWNPGTEDGPFDTEPVYYEPPSELKGTDQILINSGRIILSSKDSEMIFFSKGNFSIVSDGKFTLDNGNDGASIDLNGEYRTTTNDNDMYFLGGSADIYLNTESQDEPLARGQTLIDILSEILDELQKEIHPTPSGPSSPPTNASAYAKIQSKLDTILSTQNFTE